MSIAGTAAVIRSPRRRSSLHPLSFDNIIGAREQCRRQFETERLGGLEIDEQLERGWLFNRQVGGFRAPKNPIHVIRAAPSQVGKISSITDEATELYVSGLCPPRSIPSADRRLSTR